MLIITICATKSYTYAMKAQARRVVANIFNAKIKEGIVALVGDSSDELREIGDLYSAILPAGWTCQIQAEKDMEETGVNYKEEAQLRIGRMRSSAFALGRKLGAKLLWSLDSDVLPPANALRCMVTMLTFDDGYYSIASCPYPNTAFLGGFGTPNNPIAPDFLPHERKLPKQLATELAANDEELRKLQRLKKPITPAHQKRWGETSKKVDQCAPDGNIWQVIAKHGWRRRGWLDHAYPAIGKGSVVPIDWCGFGCTLINEEALSRADFEGYDGKGTEDLFICWHRWFPAGLRLNCVTHCPCDHVIWDGKKKNGDANKYLHLISYHEAEGEYRGHLRVQTKPWTDGQPEGAAKSPSPSPK